MSASVRQTLDRRSGLALTLTLTLLAACQTGPFGRHRVVTLSAAQEQKLGADAYRQVLAEQKSKVLPADAAVTRRVAEIGGRLARASADPAFRSAAGLKGAEGFDWDFRVVDEPTVNAFCLPGGKVVVYTGILPVCRTDAGLAVVLGHEVSHALARHGAERLTQQQLATAGAKAAEAGLGGTGLGATAQAGVMRALNAGEQYGLLAYSRRHESEADHMGLLLTAAAGYDPAEAVGFWERMAATGGGAQGPVFASTHPAHATRIGDLRTYQADARRLLRDPQPDRDLPER